MIPDAVQKVQNLNHIEDGTAEPVPFSAAVDGTEGQPAWNLLSLFNRPNQPGVAPRTWPPADAFTLYLMSALCRFSYQPASRWRDKAQEALSGALDGAALTIVTNPLIPYLRHDVWRTEGNAQVIAIQGTTALLEWLAYSVTALGPAAYLPTDWRGYAGILVAAEAYRAAMLADATGSGPNSGPTIFTGHSLGGAIAQILSGVCNQAFKAAHVEQGGFIQCRSQYTFGAPAWLSDAITTQPIGWLDSHCRCYLEGDPVPHATQVAIRKTQGVALGISLLVRQRFPFGATTKHYANKHVSLNAVTDAQRGDVRDRIWRSLVEAGTQLVRTLIEQHSVATYTAAAYQRCLRQRTVPAGRLAAVHLADQMMDLADAGAV